MTHDLEDLLNLIKELEERIVYLEKIAFNNANPQLEDAWYWEHG